MTKIELTRTAAQAGNEQAATEVRTSASGGSCSACACAGAQQQRGASPHAESTYVVPAVVPSAVPVAVPPAAPQRGGPIEDAIRETFAAPMHLAARLFGNGPMATFAGLGLCAFLTIVTVPAGFVRGVFRAGLERLRGH